MESLSIAQANDALGYISPDLPRDEWWRILAAVKSEFGDDARDAALNWSQAGDTFKQSDFNSTWRSLSGDGVGIGTLIYEAKQCGWTPSKQADSSEQRRQIAESKRQREKDRAQNEKEQKLKQAEAEERANAILGESTPADPQHSYLVDKQIQPYQLRQSGDDLIVPLLYQAQVVNIQRIHPDGSKRFLYGGRVSGCYYAIRGASDKLYIAEGVATGHTVHASNGASVACALTAGNLLAVAKYFRGRYPDLAITIVADNDHRTKGNPGLTKGVLASNAINARLVWPAFPDKSPGTDFNDLQNMGLGVMV